MKKLSILFTFSTLLICLNAIQIFAQSTKDNFQEKIVVNFYLLDEYVVGKDGEAKPTHTLEVPNQSKEFEEPLGGGFATVECSYCPLSSEFDFFITKVEKVNDNETRVFFNVHFKNKSKCNTNSTITVIRNKEIYLN